MNAFSSTITRFKVFDTHRSARRRAVREWIASATVVAIASGTMAVAIAASTIALAGAPAAREGKSSSAQYMPSGASLIEQGRQIFRYDTFGDEALWTDQLRMHEVVATSVSPATALAVGLKVDVDALPESVREALAAGTIDLDDPAVTITLLKLNAVVGLQGEVEDVGGTDTLMRLGVSCALCHSTVDNSFAAGIGHRLDGWPNRDLDPGAIIALSPAVPDAFKAVYESWGPGMYDARFNLFRDTDLDLFTGGEDPPHDVFATVIPPAYGLAGIERATFTGDGDVEHEPVGPVAYWNRYVAVTQMGGLGFFDDARLAAIGAAVPVDNTHGGTLPDLVTPALPALQAYELSLAAPRPPAGSYDAEAAARGRQVFRGPGQCATCHSGPALTDANLRLHPKEASAAANTDYVLLSATGQWRTSPLAGAWQHAPYFHDGSAATLLDVVNAYDAKFDLQLSPEQRSDLVEYLKSLPGDDVFADGFDGT
ncbi:MAG TPA: c-type cytochrome [Rhodanobacteraceae bacterium]|nr:c-type cytochrome [Rhodanobacteraceae bacterium]